jgi:hypothetical protein
MAGRLSAVRASHNQASGGTQQSGQQTSGKGGDRLGGFFCLETKAPGMKPVFRNEAATHDGWLILGRSTSSRPERSAPVQLSAPCLLGERGPVCRPFGGAHRFRPGSAAQNKHPSVPTSDRSRHWLAGYPAVAPGDFNHGRDGRHRPWHAGLAAAERQPRWAAKTRACPGNRAPPYADSKDTPALTNPGAPFGWQANIKVPRRPRRRSGEMLGRTRPGRASRARK